MKKFRSDSDHTEVTMIRDRPSGMPDEIVPPGLDLARREYLHKEIAEFCTPETRDLVCPAPSESPKPKKTNEMNP